MLLLLFTLLFSFEYQGILAPSLQNLAVKVLFLYIYTKKAGRPFWNHLS